MDDSVRKHDKIQGVFELGPRSLALLRRMVFLLEAMADAEGADPGKASESGDVTWPEE